MKYWKEGSQQEDQAMERCRSHFNTAFVLVGLAAVLYAFLLLMFPVMTPIRLLVSILLLVPALWNFMKGFQIQKHLRQYVIPSWLLAGGALIVVIILYFLFRLLWPYDLGEFSMMYWICMALLVPLDLMFGWRDHLNQNSAPVTPQEQEDDYVIVDQLEDASDMSPELEKMITLLNRQMHTMEIYQKKLPGLLQSVFQNSALSKSRYEKVLGAAAKLMRNNLEDARRTAAMFGSAPLSDRRRSLMDQYVQTSSRLLSQSDGVIDELVAL